MESRWVVSKNKCGLTEKQRKKLLQDLGFKPVRWAKGSHMLWEHADLKLLANTHSIEQPPANLGSSSFTRNPWEIIVPDDPANGTWNNLVKLARWCDGAARQITAGSDHDRQRCEMAAQFNGAAARPPKAGKKRKQFLREQAAARNSGMQSPSPM